MIIRDFLVEIYEKLSSLLLTVFTWYEIVIWFAIIYIVIHFASKRIQNREAEKKKIIREEIEEYQLNKKEINSENIDTNKNFEDKAKNKIGKILIKKPSDEELEEQRIYYEIVKKHKGNPALVFLMTLIQVMVFVSMTFYFVLNKEVEFDITYYLIALISFAIILMKGNFLLFKGIIVIVFIFIYWHLSGATMLFLAIVLFYRMVESVRDGINKKKKEAEKEKEK